MLNQTPYPSENPWEYAEGCPPEEKTRGEKVLVVLLILLSLACLVVLGLLVYRKLAPQGPLTGEPVSGSSPISVSDFVPTTEPLPTPEPIPEPTPSPTAGLSTAGTQVEDVVYTKAGKVESLRELLDGEWVDWVYVYDDSDVFQYRYRNIGTVESKLADYPIPGTDTNCSETLYEVHNCIGFTLEFQITEIYKGTGSGERRFYIRSGGNWLNIGLFDYPVNGRYDVATYAFRFDNPTSFDAFGTHRVNADDSMFGIYENLTNVLVADYEYVSLG